MSAHYPIGFSTPLKIDLTAVPTLSMRVAVFIANELAYVASGRLSERKKRFAVNKGTQIHPTCCGKQFRFPVSDEKKALHHIEVDVVAAKPIHDINVPFAESYRVAPLISPGIVKFSPVTLDRHSVRSAPQKEIEPKTASPGLNAVLRGEFDIHCRVLDDVPREDLFDRTVIRGLEARPTKRAGPVPVQRRDE